MFWTAVFIFAALLCCAQSQPSPVSAKCIGCAAGQLCVNGTCTFCLSDAQCQAEISSTSVCRANDSISACDNDCLCVHRRLSDGIAFKDILAVVLMVIGGAFAAGGGVGGGGVFVPTLMLVAGFSTKEAIPLSTLMIACASIANYFQMRMKPHPIAARPLIDYDIALLMQPSSIAGTVIGVVMNQVLPEFVLLFFLIALLCMTIYRTGRKGLQLYGQENQKLSAVEPPKEPTLVVALDVPLPTPPPSPPLSEPASPPMSPGSPDSRSPMVEKPKINWMPWNVLGALVGNLVLITLHSIIVGGKGAKISVVGIIRCSATYWVLYLAIFPIMLAISYWAIKRVAATFEARLAAGEKAVEGDVEWTLKRSTIVSGGASLAGVFSSSLGIGGGMVLTPIMLELGMLADVTAATSSFMILFTAWSAVPQYAIAKRILWDYGIIFGIAGGCSSILGQTVLDIVVKRYKRKSPIIFAAVGLICVSAVLLVYTSGSSIYRTYSEGGNMGFKSYC